jgi:hypothetical protein
MRRPLDEAELGLVRGIDVVNGDGELELEESVSLSPVADETNGGRQRGRSVWIIPGRDGR